MTFEIFTIIVLLSYIFYFALMLTMDAAKFRQSALATASAKQDFVVPQVHNFPVKVSVKNSDDADLPQIESDEHEDKPEPLPQTQDQPKAADSNLFDALGIETISEEDAFEVDGEALNFMLS